MALNNASADVLGTAIAGALTALPATTTSEAYWQAACRLIYASLVADAVVNTNVAVASVTLVTAGLAASGPGAGTGVGTLT